MESVDADSAVLIFPWADGTLHDSAIVTSGNIDRSFVIRNPPRPNGLGARVLKDHETDFIPNLAKGQKEDELLCEYPEIHQQGISLAVAVPLHAGNLKGVLYVHHRHPGYPEKMSFHG